MRELAHTINAWVDGGHRVAVVRVAELTGFGAVPAGELLAVRDDGERAGDVLRGVLDQLVAEVLPQVFGGATVTVDGPVGEHDAVAAGLACSGHARLLVHPVAADRDAWAALAEGRPAALASSLDGSGHQVILDPTVTEDADEVRATAASLLAAGATSRALVGDVLVDAWVPPPVLLTVGGGVLAAALAAQARLLGWEPRDVHGVAEATSAVAAFGPSDVLVLLDHDPAMDAVLLAGLAGRRGFLGALGSRHTQAERRKRLHAAGCTDNDLYRIHGPVGLDLGARSPAEVAVSIVAEVIADRAGRQAAPLRTTAGPISG
jgi:xanthine dehydrogenase accessory factor